MAQPADAKTFPANGELDDIKADISALRADFSKLLEDAGAVAKARADKSLDQGRDAIETAGREVDAQRAQLETRVRDNPLAAVGIAFGIGVLMAALSRR